MTAAEHKIEAYAKGSAQPSTIFTDSKALAGFYFNSLVASGKWERVVMYCGNQTEVWKKS